MPEPVEELGEALRRILSIELTGAQWGEVDAVLSSLLRAAEGGGTADLSRTVRTLRIYYKRSKRLGGPVNPAADQDDVQGINAGTTDLINKVVHSFHLRPLSPPKEDENGAGS